MCAAKALSTSDPSFQALLTEDAYFPSKDACCDMLSPSASLKFAKFAREGKGSLQRAASCHTEKNDKGIGFSKRVVSGQGTRDLTCSTCAEAHLLCSLRLKVCSLSCVELTCAFRPLSFPECQCSGTNIHTNSPMASFPLTANKALDAQLQAQVLSTVDSRLPTTGC